MDFDDFQWMELCEALGLHGDVRAFEVVEAVRAACVQTSERIAELETENANLQGRVDDLEADDDDEFDFDCDPDCDCDCGCDELRSELKSVRRRLDKLEKAVTT